MNIFMGVHTNNDLVRAGVGLAGLGRLGHPGHGRLSPARLDNGWPSPGRQAVRTVMVPWLAARPLSGHAHPVRRQQAPPQAEVDRSAPRHHGQSYRGSDPGQDGTRRSSQSYRDVEELLAERGLEVDHVTIYRWVQRFTPLLI